MTVCFWETLDSGVVYRESSPQKHIWRDMLRGKSIECKVWLSFFVDCGRSKRLQRRLQSHGADTLSFLFGASQLKEGMFLYVRYSHLDQRNRHIPRAQVTTLWRLFEEKGSLFSFIRASVLLNPLRFSRIQMCVSGWCPSGLFSHLLSDLNASRFHRFSCPEEKPSIFCPLLTILFLLLTKCTLQFTFTMNKKQVIFFSLFAII